MERITTWLGAAISEREAAATAAAAPYGGQWAQGMPEEHKDPDVKYGWDQDMVYLSRRDPCIAYQCLTDEIAALTVMHDPESVLRRCAADRKSLNDYVKTVEIRDEHAALVQAALDRGEDPGVGVLHDWHRAQYEAAIMQPLIYNLAEGYGWKEGGDE